MKDFFKSDCCNADRLGTRGSNQIICSVCKGDASRTTITMSNEEWENLQVRKAAVLLNLGVPLEKLIKFD